jgi:hypothetical protein
VECSFEPLRSLRLKNIARPVEAFLLRLDAATIGRPARPPTARTATEALPLPDKPSVAVLAFTNLSNDTEQEYFSDGVANAVA